MEHTRHEWRRGSSIVIATLGVVLFAGWGCRRGPATQDARLMQRYEQNLVREAASQTGCQPEQLTPFLMSEPPRVYTVTGCRVPIEYWLRCGRRGRRCQWQRIPYLNEQAAAVLQCAPQMISQQPTGAPNARVAVGCGHMATFAVNCSGSACGWGPVSAVQPAQGGPAAGGGGAVAAGGAGEGSGSQGGQGGTPAVVLQGQLQAQREAILSCIDSGTITLRLRWTADGEVILQLPEELIGTEGEGCIHAVLSGLEVHAEEPGEVVVPLE